MSRLSQVAVRQFGTPSGPLGRLAGLVMAYRPSNRERNRRTVGLLDVRPEDHILEIGFGPGLTIEALAALAPRGRVVGLERSELMLRVARTRNARAIAEGRVELLLGSAESLPELPCRFDKALAVNVYMFWREPAAVLAGIRQVMTGGGTVALTLQPRLRGASDEGARRSGERMAASLREAGFTDVRVTILEMSPIDAACALARVPWAGPPALT